MVVLPLRCECCCVCKVVAPVRFVKYYSFLCACGFSRVQLCGCFFCYPHGANVRRASVAMRGGGERLVIY